MQQSLASRSRRLFQPLPYMLQEQAEVLASDVAAVVEIMCGKPSPTAPSAITGAVGLDDPDAYWQQPLAGAGPGPKQPLLLLYQQTSNLGAPPGQQQQQRHTESIGQISSCILVKMIVDLWLSVGGAAAFPLVLRMLQQALYQLQPQYRARAFDIIYNLALHGSMLLPSVTSRPPSPQVQAGRGKAQQAAALGVALSPVVSPLQQQQSEGQLYRISASPGGGINLQGSFGSHSQDELAAMPSSPQLSGAYAVVQQQTQQSPGSLSPRGAAAAAVAGQQGNSSWSPSAGDASPRGRSRLSRSQLGYMAPIGSSKPSSQQQQVQGSQLGRGSDGSYTAATLTAEASGATVGAGAGGRGSASMSAVQEAAASSEAGEEAAGEAVPGLPVELAWEAWLHQLLFELLLMLSMVSETVSLAACCCACMVAVDNAYAAIAIVRLLSVMTVQKPCVCHPLV